jgi:hypothetical protein
MGLTDTPPADCPEWLIAAHLVLIGTGVLFWDATYVLMTRRALATKSYGMPLVALAANVSWEIIYVCYVIETPLETLGFAFWLILDTGIVYTTLRFGSTDWVANRRFAWIGRHIGVFLTALTVLGGVAQFVFAEWWLAVPGRTFGHSTSVDKTGKWWRGRDGLDTTEVAFWSAGLCQLILSVSSLAMLWSRGHSGGTSYMIW